MVLGWAALTIFIYICLFGPVISGIVYCFRQEGKATKIFGAIMTVLTIVVVILAFCRR